MQIKFSINSKVVVVLLGIIVLLAFDNSWLKIRMNLDKVSKIAEIIIGLATIYSVYIALRALKRSDWNSAMDTAPSILIRANRNWAGGRAAEEVGYSGFSDNQIINKIDQLKYIWYDIEFECENKGRGAAFNIQKPRITSELSLNDERSQKVPMYLTLDDDPYRFSVSLERTYDEWIELQKEKIPIIVELNYTNDEGNIKCKSIWSANLNPFDLVEGKLKVNELKILNRKGGVSYESI